MDTTDSVRRARLLPRQERFCIAFVATGVIARAARLAGYSERAARRTGWDLYQLPKIRARIAEIEELQRGRELSFIATGR